jgi:DNA-binding response OmpR family regulator
MRVADAGRGTDLMAHRFGPHGGTTLRKRVLIVEDEQDVAELVADVLSLEGFEADLAVGETAVERVLSFQPDVVLLDLMMPVVDGFEVARRLHANPTTDGIPIIVMTAMHDAASKAAQVGTHYFLSKPFDIDELVRAVKSATAPA